MTVLACIYRTVKLNCSGQYVYTRTRRHILFWKETLFNAHFSEATLLVVYWPNHGPRVDVEQGASRARGTLTVAHAQRIARFLAAVHVPGNGAVVSGWNQGHFPQDVRKGYDIQDRIRLREIQKLCANLSCAGPPRFGVCIIICTCTYVYIHYTDIYIISSQKQNLIVSYTHILANIC
jgi:hypothetical protein